MLRSLVERLRHCLIHERRALRLYRVAHDALDVPFRIAQPHFRLRLQNRTRSLMSADAPLR